MSNAAIAFRNLADSAVFTASSAASSTPASNLQNPHISIKWRGTSGAIDSFTATWASDQSADTFAVMGLGSQFLLTDAVHMQVTANGGAVGGVYDSGSTTGLVDPNYGYLVILRPAPLTFRSITWTFNKAALANEAGRVFVGLRTELTYNYAPGASFQWVDLSKETPAESGGLFIDPRPMYREWDVSFGWVTEAQYLSLVEPMDIANGAKTDILFIRDPANSNKGLVSVWGIIRLSPVLQPFNDGDLKARSYRIRERRA